LMSKLHEEFGLDIDLIVVSPMRRTIETALLALDFLLERKVPIQADARWQGSSTADR
jgi:phosphohistidine phosphatase SixA